MKWLAALLNTFLLNTLWPIFAVALTALLLAPAQAQQAAGLLSGATGRGTFTLDTANPLGGSYLFTNYMKTCTGFKAASPVNIAPYLNSDNYPTQGFSTPVGCALNIPAAYNGAWILTWTGSFGPTLTVAATGNWNSAATTLSVASCAGIGSGTEGIYDLTTSLFVSSISSCSANTIHMPPAMNGGSSGDSLQITTAGVEMGIGSCVNPLTTITSGYQFVASNNCLFYIGGSNGTIIFTPQSGVTNMNWNVITNGVVSGITNVSMCQYGTGPGQVNSAAACVAGGFNPQYINLVRALNPRTIRQLGWGDNGSNLNNHSRFAYDQPDTAFNYGSSYYPPGALAGQLTGLNDNSLCSGANCPAGTSCTSGYVGVNYCAANQPDASCSTPGCGYVDGETVIAWVETADAGTATTSATLDVGGRGVRTIAAMTSHNSQGGTTVSLTGATNYTFVYQANIQQFVELSGGEGPAIPNIEFIKFINAVGCDAWFQVPYLYDDNSAIALGALVQQNLRGGLEAWWEYSNEFWLTGSQYDYAWYYGSALGLPRAIFTPGNDTYGLRFRQVFGNDIYANWPASDRGRLHGIMSAFVASNPYTTDLKYAQQGFDLTLDSGGFYTPGVSSAQVVGTISGAVCATDWTGMLTVSSVSSGSVEIGQAVSAAIGGTGMPVNARIVAEQDSTHWCLNQQSMQLYVAQTVSSGSTICVGYVPPTYTAGMTIADATTPSAIPSNTTVTSISGQCLGLSNPLAATAPIADKLTFTVPSTTLNLASSAIATDYSQAPNRPIDFMGAIASAMYYWGANVQSISGGAGADNYITLKTPGISVTGITGAGVVTATGIDAAGWKNTQRVGLGCVTKATSCTNLGGMTINQFWCSISQLDTNGADTFVPTGCVNNAGTATVSPDYSDYTSGGTIQIVYPLSNGCTYPSNYVGAGTNACIAQAADWAVDGNSGDATQAYQWVEADVENGERYTSSGGLTNGGVTISYFLSTNWAQMASTYGPTGLMTMLYEGGNQMSAPTAAVTAILGLDAVGCTGSSCYYNKIAALITGWKYSPYAQKALNMLATGIQSTIDSRARPAISCDIGAGGCSLWALYPGDIYSSPYAFATAFSNFNAAP